MKKQTPIVSTLVSLALSSFAIGCANDDNDDGGRQLSSLSSDELVALCESVALTPQQIDGFYTLGCLIDFSESGTCEDDQLQECVDLAEAVGENPRQCEEPTAAELDALAGCTATEEEYIQCLRDTATWLASFSGLTCAALDAPPVSETPASCTAFQAKCLGLDDDSEN